MHIIQVINHAGSNHGGAENLALHLHNDLMRDGIEVDLLSIARSDTNNSDRSSSLKFKSPRDPRAIFYLAKEIRKLSRNDTIVHAHLFPSTLYVSLLRKIGVIKNPCTMTEHSTWNRRRSSVAGRILDKFIYKGYRNIVAISDATKTELLRHYNNLNDKINIIENGAVIRSDNTRIDHKDKTDFVYMSVGRLVSAKNIDGAISALASISDKNWKYIIIGDGPERGNLENLTKKLGIDDKVSFKGFQDNIPDWLSLADVFIMPSRFEGFGLAAIEAMNAGLPVVAGNVPGLRDIVSPTGAPLVDPEDIKMIADALALLKENSDMRRDIGASSFKHSLNYGKDRMNAGYIKLWKSII